MVVGMVFVWEETGVPGWNPPVWLGGHMTISHADAWPLTLNSLLLDVCQLWPLTHLYLTYVSFNLELTSTWRMSALTLNSPLLDVCQLWPWTHLYLTYVNFGLELTSHWRMSALPWTHLYLTYVSFDLELTSTWHMSALTLNSPLLDVCQLWPWTRLSLTYVSFDLELASTWRMSALTYPTTFLLFCYIDNLAISCVPNGCIRTMYCIRTLTWNYGIINMDQCIAK